MTQSGSKEPKRSTVGNVVGGFVAGLYSVPEGIGYASLAGVSPMLGIYSGMVPVAVAAATTGSVLMMSTLTSAIALTMAGVLDQSHLPADQLTQAVVTMSLLSGLMMAALGLAGLGRVVNFVSNSVMTGFVMGVAVLIMVGKFDEIFGYDPSGISNKVLKGADIVVHAGRWDPTTTGVGIGAIALAFALKAIPSLERYALVIVVVVATAVVWGAGVETSTIGDQATIATGWAALPFPDGRSQLPSLSLVPTVLVGSISIAIVALAQGAGIRPAFPNPDGSPTDASRDFLGQGLGNVVGAFFLSTPSGGSLSRTAVSAEGGASRRWAGYVAAGSVLVLVVALGSVVAEIPEAVIGGLLFVIGVELVVGRIPDARLAWRAGSGPRALFAVTFALTLVVPLQWAILGGAVLSLLSYVSVSASSAGLRRVDHDEDGWLVTTEVPDELPADEPLVLRYVGPNFFAAVPTVVDDLPEPSQSGPGVVVIDVGELERFSSTLLKQLERYLDRLEAAGSGLVLIGLSPGALGALSRTGIDQRIGPANLLAADPHLAAVLRAGRDRGQALLEELRARTAVDDAPDDAG